MQRLFNFPIEIMWWSTEGTGVEEFSLISSSCPVTGGEWRKLHNEELNGLYFLPNIVRVIKSRKLRWAGHVARMEKGRAVYRVLVGKPQGKRLLGRPRRRWEDNVRMDLQEVGLWV
jgi:hypothetical protein